jgi:hypothetical protein
MLSALVLTLFLAEAPSRTTLPRHPDPDPVQGQETRSGEPTDPWFDRAQTATSDADFILSAVESARQGVFDARTAMDRLENPELRHAAALIEQQNQSTVRKLEALAGDKGWRLPRSNPDRATTTLGAVGNVRGNADFIISQIAYHEMTLAQYRAQLSGEADPQLEKALRGALPGYEKNLELLLGLKP